MTEGLDTTSFALGRKLRVSIISPTHVGYEGEADALLVPAHDGSRGILYGHAPLVVLLGEGELVVRGDDGEGRFRVARGFLQVVDNEVAVLAEEVEAL